MQVHIQKKKAEAPLQAPNDALVTTASPMSTVDEQ